MLWRTGLAIGALVGIGLGLEEAYASEFLVVPNSDGLTANNGRVNQFDAANGSFVNVLVGPLPDDIIRGMTFGPDGNIYMSAVNTNTNSNGRVLKFDAETGAFLDVFVEPGAGGLSTPFGLVFGPDGNLYVANNGPVLSSVLRFDGATGDFVDAFVENIFEPQDMVFGPDGNLYVTSGVLDRVTRYDGTTGDFIDVFVSSGSGGLDGAPGLVFGPDGNLYIASPFTDSVFRYDGATGAFIDQFVAPGAGGLDVPTDLTFGPDGDLYVDTRVPEVVIPGGSAGAVLRYDGQTGDFIDEFVTTGSGGLGLSNPGLQFAAIPSPIQVSIDIRPGSCRNPINRRARGVLPVAVLATADFDVIEVDADSVALEGTAPLRFTYEDVAAGSDCSGSSEGFVDLTLKFDGSAIGAVLDYAERGDQRTLELTGKLLDGTLIRGTDVVLIVR